MFRGLAWVLAAAPLLSSCFLFPSLDNFTPEESAGRCYWGLDSIDAPETANDLDSVEAQAQKHQSIVAFSQPWFHRSNKLRFPTAAVELIRARGSIPLINWASWDPDPCNPATSSCPPADPCDPNQFVAAGTADCDAFIDEWAEDAHAWGFAVMIVLNRGMNREGFPYSINPQAGVTADKVQARWKHVIDRFRLNLANNVTWVWSPDADLDPEAFGALYPGHDWVDWVGLSAYNSQSESKTFSTLFAPSYDKLQLLAPDKPVLIETSASSKFGDGVKAQWILDAFSHEIPTRFTNVHAVVWSNAATESRFDAPPSALDAFRTAIGSSYYIDHVGDLGSSKLTKP